MLALPTLTKLNWATQYRVIPSVFPTIDFFESMVPSHLMEALWQLESLTNDRLRNEVGNLSLVVPEDRICGAGASVVMAAFTHVSPARQSRFSNGAYGVYYAARTLDTAIHETVYHRSRFLNYTHEAPGEIAMRAYCGKVLQPLHDIRNAQFNELRHPENYQPSQYFGEKLRAQNAWGIVYNSVRHEGGECIAILRPPAISIPKQSKHLSYVWNGEKITHIYEKSDILFEF